MSSRNRHRCRARRRRDFWRLAPASHRTRSSTHPRTPPSRPAGSSGWPPVGTVEAEVDLRVGGALRIVMKGEGMVIEHVGEFTEIEGPRRLAFTWSSPCTGRAQPRYPLPWPASQSRCTPAQTARIVARLPLSGCDSLSRRSGAGSTSQELCDQSLERGSERSDLSWYRLRRRAR
jgi:hypothetical protein